MHPLVPLLVGLAFWPALFAQELSPAETQRAAPYYKYWGLVEGADPNPLNAAIAEAQKDFAGRGPALAQHFLHHVQASPSNTAFFFLFRAVGDSATAQMLIRALMDPPMLQGLVVGRDPGELAIAIEAVLGNQTVQTDSAVVAALDGTIRQARAKPGGGRVAQTATGLLGKCRTPEATRLLEMLAADPDRAIRAAAVEALGHSGSVSAGQTLARSLASDSSAETRARAASAMLQSGSPEAAASLQAALERETDPQVVDATVAALTRLKALPQNPSACLQAAGRCWDAFVARPLFDCWRATANRDDMIRQATSGSWMMRALALHSLVETPVDPATRDRLLQSSVEILSRNFSAIPAPNSLSDSIARITRDALWDFSGRQIPVAMEFADRIVPINGHYMSVGRFGESYDLASKDRNGYAAWRRPRQLLSAGLAALLICPLIVAPRFRKIAVALLASLGAWAVWSAFQTDVRELPPPPLGYLTVSCLAFVSAGFAAGVLAGLHFRSWMKVAASPLLAGLCAFLLCGFTRASSLFPIGSEGWEQIFDPLSSAVLAAPTALILALGLACWKPPHAG